MQKDFLIFFKKPDSGDEFTFSNYEVVARVRVPDIRYIYFCCQNTDIPWQSNPTTVKITKKEHRNMTKGDAFTDVETFESWKIGHNNLPELIKGME